MKINEWLKKIFGHKKKSKRDIFEDIFNVSGIDAYKVRRNNESKLIHNLMVLGPIGCKIKYISNNNYNPCRKPSDEIKEGVIIGIYLHNYDPRYVTRYVNSGKQFTYVVRDKSNNLHIVINSAIVNVTDPNKFKSDYIVYDDLILAINNHCNICISRDCEICPLRFYSNKFKEDDENNIR